MLDSLLQYIQERSSSPLSQNDISLLHEAFLVKKLRKRQFLLQEGEVCQYIAFIVKGATRQYTIDEKGDVQVLNLCLENWWTADRESFHKGTPSIYNIDAWEDTHLLLLPKANGYYDRVNSIPAFRDMRIKLDDNNHMAAQQRLLASKNYPAEYRYEELMKQYPLFLQRFPQHLIASYLGITKETLSRIRHQSAKKESR
ncbi:putative transcriptional regulator, Crp/Fnr family [Fibrisoma limi BUZ 3]|uniref:Putative transcriptional regulator, Crp/Fnr family n=1 Tax=Fibrisoma limi BUZ 3 TaxID=1185876 RepID=I2GGE9_9BACT|nr:Crp/Fnr family transcriptional regulator [Fibrisoma limi]CCH52974.1 putative transcriptional regulator, Crp/Fnr family [Fibrisoma limi BUZ 3]